MRHHGMHGRLYADISLTADGSTLTEIPFQAEWTLDTSRPTLDVTAMGDANAAELRGHKATKGTMSGYEDTATDMIRKLNDGKPRKFVLVQDTTQTTKKGWAGHATFDASFSGGVSKAVSNSMTFSASGDVNEFSGVVPDAEDIDDLDPEPEPDPDPDPPVEG